MQNERYREKKNDEEQEDIYFGCMNMLIESWTGNGNSHCKIVRKEDDPIFCGLFLLAAATAAPMIWWYGGGCC